MGWSVISRWWSAATIYPEGLVTILSRLGLNPGEALYAGDADADVLGGAEAGVRTILIRHGREVELAVRDKAWRHVDAPAEAYALIAEVVAYSPENHQQ